MIFLTVGTYPLPFDRLIKAVDNMIIEGRIEEEVFAQIGLCSYKPENMEFVGMLQKEAFDRQFSEASAIIGHAGIGTIVMTLEQEKPLLVMPRMKRYNEIVNDHQIATARKFEELGHILVAYGAEELPGKIEQLRTFVPRKRKAQPQAVTERISRFLMRINERG